MGFLEHSYAVFFTLNYVKHFCWLHQFTVPVVLLLIFINTSAFDELDVKILQVKPLIHEPLAWTMHNIILSESL